MAAEWVMPEQPSVSTRASWMTPSLTTRMALNKDDEVIGYEFVNLGKMMDFIKKGDDANTALAWLLRPLPRSSRLAPTARPPSENADWVRP